MVLGLRSKSRKDNGIFVEYLISIKELKPWPNNLVPAQCVLLKWANAETSNGSFIAVVGNETIMFNESFTLTLVLDQKGQDKFHKNLLEFNVFDARKDKNTDKNKFLGSAVVNLAEHGIVRGCVPVGVPFSFKKNSRNDSNSVLYLTIEPVVNGFGDENDERNSSCSSPKTSFSRPSMELDVSCTDDDDGSSSQSSRRVSFSATNDYINDNNDNNKLISMGQNHPNTSQEGNGEEKKGWKHITLKHSTNEATLVSEIENLLREEERKRVSNQTTPKPLARSQTEKRNDDAVAIETNKPFPELKPLASLPPEAVRKQMKLRTNTLALGRKTLGMEGVPRLKQLKSIQLHFDTDEIRKKMTMKGSSDKVSVAKESKTEILEEELRETAALEAAIYSINPEHSRSQSKVHAPARRLSRFYLHACKASSNSKRASAARAVVSGLVLVSKACGNDVPRLTFWLSNAIMLRTIVGQGVQKMNLSSGDDAPLGEKKLEYFLEKDEWADPRAFLAALERFEAWIFPRIVKSVWWQSFTPHMQSACTTRGSISRKSSGKRRSGHKNHGRYSIELWKNAFRAACERLCPLRGTRQECGCLPMLAKLVMEQLISRLDVAMFNAILRESPEEMPTDPVSDPISDINVLPVPAGKASFGAGAQLKNSTGTWSRWLADQFDRKDDSASRKDENPECESFRLFHLLNALGDLMMLPFKMLADKSTRREVCPSLGPLIIKRVLRNFVPDEFNPHRIPRRLFDILNSEVKISDLKSSALFPLLFPLNPLTESAVFSALSFLQDSAEAGNGCITSFPCAASPTFYSTPTEDLIKSFIGEFSKPSLSRNGSSVFKKQYTSDDELDDLDTAINSIISAAATNNASEWLPKGYGHKKAIRYQLLREAWRDDAI
ncbi:PREDICTED: uncharacterized protein LOC104814192 isoform X2 [Tarenaya hassleriana]|uniref:uncharacterized protein LOC104814192 isoform X2 n=1 Tax=Tarenaya hassleriana TaxID=28532 RepID=UPI00053C9F10|nr:PREDICTED: uncharacterized protein LOC104814192 isoform X2 [Tarenaya hassleriana]